MLSVSPGSAHHLFRGEMPATAPPVTPPGCLAAQPDIGSPWALLPRSPRRGRGHASPPASAARSRQPFPERVGSRTAAPPRTCPVYARREVTRGAALIAAVPAGPLADTGSPDRA